MNPPTTVSVESKPDKPDESKPNPKTYDCGLCDTEVVYKIAQELLPGLASACVDNTTGGLFKNAGTVAVDMRKEMSDYLSQRSETYVAEFLLSEKTPVLETSEHPYDIILTLIDDFTSSKRNMLSRVSEWVFTDGREDRIDDFVQEMEINGFWLLARRETIAAALLKNVDYKNSFHCNMVCGSEEEIAKHRLECKFRPLDCVNEGCTTRYCAIQKENHEAICPFMILPCEQKCSDFVMRREMDRHCVTICPMKLVNCAFYTVGCKSCIPKCNVQQHNVDDLSSHLFFIMRTAHKEANENDLIPRVEQIRSIANTEKLAKARDARALTYLIKDAEAKVGPLEPKTNPPDSPTKTEPVIVKNGVDSSTKKEDHPEPPPGKPAMGEVDKEPAKPVESTEPVVKIEERKDKQESSSLPIEKEDEQSGPPLKKEETKEEGKPSDSKEDVRTKSPNGEKVEESIDEKSRKLSSGDEEGNKKSPEKDQPKTQ